MMVTRRGCPAKKEGEKEDPQENLRERRQFEENPQENLREWWLFDEGGGLWEV